MSSKPRDVGSSCPASVYSGAVDLRSRSLSIPRSDHPGFPVRPKCIDEGAARMCTDDLGREEVRHDRSEDHERERRLGLLVRRLPTRLQTGVRWLRRRSARWVRIPVGLLLILGSVFSILPIFGLWMLPLGLVLLAEDVEPLRHGMNRLLAWIEHRRPHWMGLPQAPRSHTSTSEKGTS
jgi:hypothetical protein